MSENSENLETPYENSVVFSPAVKCIIWGIKEHGVLCNGFNYTR